MSHSATLIFPHQLFAKHPGLLAGRVVYLVEGYLFFTQYSFHKQKLAFHRASMCAYAEMLRRQGFVVEYISVNQISGVKEILRYILDKGIQELHLADTVDNYLERDICKFQDKNNLHLVRYESPQFFLTKDECVAYASGRKRLLMNDFYKTLRKKYKILVDSSEIPTGGIWSFDKENRKKIPRGLPIPGVWHSKKNKYWEYARASITKEFPKNYGSLDVQNYPVTHAEAQDFLQHFLENRLSQFGPYEDALCTTEGILFHSSLSPLINIGILTPQEVVLRALAYAETHDVPLPSLEGFIRQILGWREFMRLQYIVNGTDSRNKNFWGHTRKIPQMFWQGNTGVLPLDLVIQRTLKNAYAHHIERLMVLGNFMLLSEYNPDEVYRWFMEMYIDAYDWVMVPNVYGMSQYADGGLFATKPYISGSAYLKRMSDYPKGQWEALWDARYWLFIKKNKSFFASNHRLSMMSILVDKIPEDKISLYKKISDDYKKIGI